jgi:hypothetical protein
MAKNEVTSKRVGKIAGKALRNPSTPKRLRPAIASDLAQAPDKPRQKPKRRA